MAGPKKFEEVALKEVHTFGYEHATAPDQYGSNMAPNPWFSKTMGQGAINIMAHMAIATASTANPDYPSRN